MTAVREAASLLQSFPDLTTVKFFIGSQATLRTFQADFITSKLALQAANLLNAIPAQNVFLVWTKAHIGNPGNERADSLAKAGSLLQQPLAIPTPRASVRANVKDTILGMWAREWQAYPGARQTKIFHPHYDSSLSKALLH